MAALTGSQIPVIVSRVRVEELTRRGQTVIRTTVDHFGSRAQKQLGVDSFNMRDPRVAQFLNRWGAERIADANRTTQGRLARVLSQGVANGDGYSKMAKDIKAVFQVAKGSRAATIARTEVARASNFGSKEGYRQLGVEQKEWQATIDEFLRDSHADLDGTVVDIDDDFVTASGASADYPGNFGLPEEDINCRCGILPVVDEKRMSVNRTRLWKMLERERSPYQRRLRVQLAHGFTAQEKEVMAAFNEMAIQEAA